MDHHVFLNLKTEKFYCLPEDYEVDDPSLHDILQELRPRFSPEPDQLNQLGSQWVRAADGSQYLPGMVGLNNIKETDYVNVVIQALMRVYPLRGFFLAPENYVQSSSPLVHRFGELTRKIWNGNSFKSHVSPHEFMQAVMATSNKRFCITEQSDPVSFLVWLLNALHAGLATRNSIIHQCFQGELEEVDVDNHHRVKKIPFLVLAVDLPPAPVFLGDEKFIPQVPLSEILKKFDGKTTAYVAQRGHLRFRVTKLPRYLIMHYKGRFHKNNFFTEKNPTLVRFPVKNLELRESIPVPDSLQRSKYNLVASVAHDGDGNKGSYRAYVQSNVDEAWYEMQDLRVSEALAQLVGLSEAYFQVYEQQ